MNLIQVEITNVCNLKCKFCFREFMTRPQGFMDVCTFRKSLRLAHNLKVKEVWLHNWGESLLHPKFTKFVKHASKNFRVGFATNGTLLSFKKIRELKANGLTYLDISMNMETKRFNLVHLVAMYQVANELGIDCHFRIVVSNKAEYEYFSSVFKTFKVRWQRAMLRTDTPRTEKCLAKDRVLVVLFNGDVVACCSDYNGVLKYGKVGTKLNMKLNELENEFCKRCGEVSEEMPIRRKL